MNTWELNGLRTILEASTAGTLHTIREPPDRDEYASDEDYDRAYADWVGLMYWKVTRSSKHIGQGDT